MSETKKVPARARPIVLLAILAACLTLAILVVKFLVDEEFIFAKDEPHSGDVLFQDDFSKVTGFWKVQADANASSKYAADGQYQVQVFTPQVYVLRMPGRYFANSLINVDVTNNGTDNNGFGIVCRMQDNGDFYFMLVTSDGYQGIGRHVAGESQYLSGDSLQPTDAVLPGAATNSLRGECNGQTLSLYANGTLLSSVTDASFTSGQAGLMVSSFDEPGVSVSFDNFAVVQP